MNEPLVISEANLDVIESSLNSMVQGLNGVAANVNAVNQNVNAVTNQVADMGSRVDQLNNDLKNLVREVKDETIITNARQAIMYNNEIIEKKFGYYSEVRRIAEGLIGSVEKSSVKKETLSKLREELIINNPNYWLADALSAVSLWILDDKEGCDRELYNALRKDDVKTSIFFSLFNLKLGRENASINWLKTYLNKLNPADLSTEFVTVLDLVSSGVFGVGGKNIVVNKLTKWINVLFQNGQIMNNEINKWISFINTFENNNYTIPYIEHFVEDGEVFKSNLVITSSYDNILKYLNSIGTENNTTKGVDEILNNLIYEYEDKEKTFELDNLKNRLIIDCNGDVEKANELYEREKYVYVDNINLLSLLSNIVMFRNDYKVNNETQKLALTLIGFLISNAYQVRNLSLKDSDLSVNLDGSVINVDKDINRNKINEDVNTYLNDEFKGVSKYLYVLLFIINIIGIIGILTLLNNSMYLIILISFLVVSNGVLLYKVISEHVNNKKLRKIKSDAVSQNLDMILAEYTDYRRLIADNQKKFTELDSYLKSLDLSNYTKVSDGRELSIGE